MPPQMAFFQTSPTSVLQIAREFVLHTSLFVMQPAPTKRQVLPLLQPEQLVVAPVMQDTTVRPTNW